MPTFQVSSASWYDEGRWREYQVIQPTLTLCHYLESLELFSLFHAIGPFARLVRLVYQTKNPGGSRLLKKSQEWNIDFY